MYCVCFAPEKVNVHIPRRPYANIGYKACKGFLYGFVSGAIMGLVAAKTRSSHEDINIIDTSKMAFFGGIGIGLAGALWEGGNKAAKEYNKRNLNKVRKCTLYKKS